MFGALSHQSSELELNQEDHMLTQAAHTVKICEPTPCWVLHLKWLRYFIWEEICENCDYLPYPACFTFISKTNWSLSSSCSDTAPQPSFIYIRSCGFHQETASIDQKPVVCRSSVGCRDVQNQKKTTNINNSRFSTNINMAAGNYVSHFTKCVVAMKIRMEHSERYQQQWTNDEAYTDVEMSSSDITVC